MDGFSDPMVDCKETKLRYRADQLFWSEVILQGDENKEIVGYVCVQEANDDDMVKAAKKQSKKLLKEKDLKGNRIEAFSFKELIEATEEEMTKIPSPASGKPTLTAPRDFNLMFETRVGAAVDSENIAYLRPETAQGIFINFKNVLDSSRQKIPFGIAQMGKAFRNEITPRNFIFRSREFEQMEVEYFIPPGDDVWPEYHQKWIDASRDFLVNVCELREDLMGWDVHEGDGLAHYARACTDVTFTFPFGTQELMGIAARGDYDLTQHTNGSGKSAYRIVSYHISYCILCSSLLYSSVASFFHPYITCLTIFNDPLTHYLTTSFYLTSHTKKNTTPKTWVCTMTRNPKKSTSPTASNHPWASTASCWRSSVRPTPKTRLVARSATF